MATELVDASKLDACCTAEANAIRAKTGSSAQIAYDWANSKGFADAIAAISGGGGFDISDYFDHNLSGTILWSGNPLQNITLRGQQYITSISLPNVLSLALLQVNSAFADMPSLASFSAPKATRVVDFMLSNCTSLNTVDLKAVTDSGNGLFMGCTSLQVIVFPAIATIYSQAFRNCTSLETADVLASNGFTNQNNFNGCSSLTTLIIRKSGVATLSHVNNFTDTPFDSGGSGGTLYVPSAEISSYQTAANWSTILGYANNQIKSIESTHTDPTAPIDLTLYYADGTPITP